MKPNSSIASFSDPHPFQNAIRVGDFDVIPTVRGDFQSELMRIDLQKVWMQRASEGLPRIIRGSITTDRVVITFLTAEAQAAMQYSGMELTPDDVAFTGSGLMHVTSSAACDWGSMSLSPDDFVTASEAITGRQIDLPSATRLFRPSPEILGRLRAVHRAVGDLARSEPETLALPGVTRTFENELTNLMIRSLNDGEPVKLTAASNRYRMLVGRFEEFLNMKRTQPVYLTEICAAIGACERTLRNACQQQFGVNPTRYLWLRRMYLARQALLTATAQAATVTQVAMENGFWELGRFAAEYRSLFGESPSVTLRRPPSAGTDRNRREFAGMHAQL